MEGCFGDVVREITEPSSRIEARGSARRSFQASAEFAPTECPRAGAEAGRAEALIHGLHLEIQRSLRPATVSMVVEYGKRADSGASLPENGVLRTWPAPA